MIIKKISLIPKVLFWIAPVCFWLGWQLIVSYPHALWILVVASVVLLLPVAYEAAGRKFSWHFFFVFISSALLLNSFYLFLSLLSLAWLTQTLFLLMVWHLYRYFIASKKAAKGDERAEWAQISLYGGLLTIFLAAVSLFGLQSFLSLSPWPLLLLFLLVLFINTRAIAFSQFWNKREDWYLWPLLALLTGEIAMMLTLLPLNYLIAAILCTLAYYSVINFARLYLNGYLSGRKIKNYALFTAISLVAILLTARWL